MKGTRNNGFNRHCCWQPIVLLVALVLHELSIAGCSCAFTPHRRPSQWSVRHPLYQRRTASTTTLKATAGAAIVTEAPPSTTTTTIVTTTRETSTQHQRRRQQRHPVQRQALKASATSAGATMTTDSYNAVLAGLAQQGLIVECEALLRVMEKGPKTTSPNCLSYSYILDALGTAAAVASTNVVATSPSTTLDNGSRCNNIRDIVQLGERAEEILRHVETKYKSSRNDETGGSSCPTTILYNKVLKVWKNIASSSSSSATTTNIVAAAAERRSKILLQHMIDNGVADTISYTSYMATAVAAASSTSTTIESAQYITTLANELLLRSSSSNSSAITATANGDDAVGTRAIKPTSQTWNTVLSAWVRCGQPHRAQEILYDMESYTDPSMHPNVVSYTTVMDGYAKMQQQQQQSIGNVKNNNDAIQNMEEVWERMKCRYHAGYSAAEPNLWTYVTLIHTYAKQRERLYTQKAQDLIYYMYNIEYIQNKKQHLKPNTQLVTAVMDAWPKSDTTIYGAIQAEALLDWMIDTSTSSRSSNGMNNPEHDLEPNEYSFSSVIAAWARSRCIGKAQKARNVLDRMIQLHECGQLKACPNTICYTAVINACAHCCETDAVDQSNALRIAIATYRQMLETTPKYGIIPNHVTYTSLLTAIRNLVPATSPKRCTAIQDIFRTAATNGYVDENVLQRLKSALSPEELEGFHFDGSAGTRSHDWRFDQIPMDWKRNVIHR